MLSINRFGGLFSQPLGYVIIRVQVEGMKDYDKDQVALVIPGSTTFGTRVPITLGTPTISWIVNVIKEREIDELSVLLNGSKISHLLAGHWAGLSIGSHATTGKVLIMTDLNEAVKMMKREGIDAFLSKVIHGQMKTMFMDNNMCVMTKAPEKGKVPCLLHGLSRVNTYTEMTTGSRQVVVVVKNLKVAPINICKGIKVT